MPEGCPIDRLPRLFQRPDKLHEQLHVVVPLFNAARYRSRWQLFEDFILRVEHAGGTLWIVEVAFGNRDFVCTRPDHPRHLQLRTWDMLWHKERMINLMVQRFPLDWQKMAWIDGDVRFARDDWVDETLHQLEHYPLVQLWSHALDLDSQHRPLVTQRSLADIWMQEGPTPSTKLKSAYAYGLDRRLAYPGHPGYAWAARREWWDAVGGLFDVSILGSGDTIMAQAMIGRVDAIMGSQYPPALRQAALHWTRQMQQGHWQGRPLLGNVGVVEGLLLHFYHGSKANRGYRTRGQILQVNDFDPQLDLRCDWQGLYAFTERRPPLRRACAQYFSERDEDATT